MTVRFHVPITYFDWPTVPKEIKDKIFELIKAGFVVDPRSKKTVIQNAGVCFRQFKYRLMKTYVLLFLDNVEKLKFPPNEYSFIEQQHLTEFVASLLKEDFKKKSENGKEKWKQHKYIHRTFRKGYANLWRSCEEDILTRALGGKDCLGIVLGVGKYVTKKKYFHTATQQKTNEKEDEKATSKEHDRMAKRIKELDVELLKMKEKDDCLDELKEEPGMESQKDVKDVVELNEEIKVNIEKDDEQVEGVTLEKMKMNSREFSKDMVTFAPTPIQTASVALRFLLRMVEHMGLAIQITTPFDVFGVRRKCCIMIESLKDFSSMCPIATAYLDAYIMYLYTCMESLRTLNLYKFFNARSISCGSSKEEHAQLLTVRLLGTDYDQLLLIPYNSGYADNLK
ncbi:uncharacterized protein E5676_scaffold832G00860 [Cucumis melo var. makuwa]|uniref:Uncharacterized protein n=1 Tax=Cucumis melo var. makuwa TaxID=1194695 RepID=A0A5A7T6J2_CUCMM|nr:uncharacterized protein E6C27_scaffold379G00890 [Cucumis melo var. makuwa]TYK13896.1 uncharacterized protein E5676_scaffold832G00860 [Cucumis melo var. makuwa]